MRKIIYGCLFLTILSACSDKKVETKGLKQEIDSYKIKRIKPGEIIIAAEETGNNIVRTVQGDITTRIDSALVADDFEKAMLQCRARESHLISQLQNQYVAKIKRAGFPNKLRNEGNNPDSTQKQILDAYIQLSSKGMSPANDVFKTEKEIFFNAPIFLSSKSCLRCHGIIGADIDKKDYEKILKKYPHDKSVGFKLNEPIGVWTVAFDAAELIRNIK